MVTSRLWYLCGKYCRFTSNISEPRRTVCLLNYLVEWARNDVTGGCKTVWPWNGIVCEQFIWVLHITFQNLEFQNLYGWLFVCFSLCLCVSLVFWYIWVFCLRACPSMSLYGILYILVIITYISFICLSVWVAACLERH